MDSISDPMLILTSTFEIIRANTAAQILFGIESLPAALAAAVPEPLVKLARDGELLPEWSPDGEHVYIARIQQVNPERPLPEHHLIFVLRDVTQFRKLSRNQHEFMRIAAHDLRSPLTSIQGFANMLQLGLVGELNEKQLQFVEKVLSGISQMTALVENIQDAGRFDPETGFYEMLREPTDLMDLVTEIVRKHLIPAEKSELTITTEIADDIPILSADTNMLERAIANLVDNAIKYTPNGGRITIKVFVQDRSVIVGVQDNGLGISPENQKRLFQRHQRIARQEHKRVKGSGLGLFIVRSVAQRHNGEAWVESTEGQGSTFFMRIPLDGTNGISTGNV